MLDNDATNEVIRLRLKEKLNSLLSPGRVLDFGGERGWICNGWLKWIPSNLL